MTLEEEEGAAFGAAIQSIWNYRLAQGEKVKIEEITGKMIKKGISEINPEPQNFPLYEELQERFNSLWQTLKEEFKIHRKLKTDSS